MLDPVRVHLHHRRCRAIQSSRQRVDEGLPGLKTSGAIRCTFADRGSWAAAWGQRNALCRISGLQRCGGLSTPKKLWRTRALAWIGEVKLSGDCCPNAVPKLHLATK